MTDKKRVLIVDDDSDVLDLIAEMLPENITVLKEQTEEVALLMLQTQELDAVICDISLRRGGSGLKLLEVCRARRINVPFVFITGDVTKDKALFALRLGAHDVLEKPVNIEYFNTKFNRVMEEGYSIRRIRTGLGKIQELVGQTKNKETEFVEEYLTLVEANRLRKKTS